VSVRDSVEEFRGPYPGRVFGGAGESRAGLRGDGEYARFPNGGGVPEGVELAENLSSHIVYTVVRLNVPIWFFSLAALRGASHEKRLYTKR
jgi:hypothetical protein